jgi:dephospho-CoA kinase
MKTHTLSIGLTGGIGSGKTLIGNAFRVLGIPIFIADIEAKKCYEDKKFLSIVAKEISTKIVVKGVFQKQILANIIFNDKEALAKLNSIIHPLVLDKYLTWKSKQDKPYVIAESAIIFEIDWQKHFEKVICINTPTEVALERVEKRDNATREDILARMSNQMPIEEKIKLSDYIIFHDNNTMLMPQILAIHNQILELNK